MPSAWRQWGHFIVLVAIALSLQGCGLDNALSLLHVKGSPHALSLLQSDDGILVRPKGTEQMAERDDDEDADVVDMPRSHEELRHPRTRQSPGFSLLSTGSETSDSSGTTDFDAIARGSDRVKKSALDKALQMDLAQQSELQDDYAKMLYLNDPDDVDKASQLAWLKMEYEDRRLAKAMLKDAPQSRRKPHLSQLQLDDTIHQGSHRPRMLNSRRHSEPAVAAPVPVARPVEQIRAAVPAPAPFKAADPADDADIADF